MNFEPSISFNRLTDKNIIYAIEFNNRKVPSYLLFTKDFFFSKVNNGTFPVNSQIISVTGQRLSFLYFLYSVSPVSLADSFPSFTTAAAFFC